MALSGPAALLAAGFPGLRPGLTEATFQVETAARDFSHEAEPVVGEIRTAGAPAGRARKW